MYQHCSAALKYCVGQADILWTFLTVIVLEIVQSEVWIL